MHVETLYLQHKAILSVLTGPEHFCDVVGDFYKTHPQNKSKTDQKNGRDDFKCDETLNANDIKIRQNNLMNSSDEEDAPNPTISVLIPRNLSK